MLERLLDVAVYALMAALVAIGVGKILDQRRDAQTIAWTESVTRAMERLAATRTGYATNAATDMTAELIGSGLLPTAMIDRNSSSAPTLRNAFGGALTVVADPGSFVITQDTVPPGSCIALVGRARDWAQTICVNGTCVGSATADTAWASQRCDQSSGQKNIVVVTIVP
ncbi:type 4 pilus major pilin [Roseiterribacter gracilis]|uniref:Type 4 secretion system PilS N-terminal domain-containing protein n=1 Tax=Roseiterribacter gracilis TaxID=2812848 RepID=A0A8S8XKG1_9PROT|nr:hypothetical protein TMPK1_35170 [Rhodospirillales bacterium TMPK1]